MPKFVDITGQRFGRLVVQSRGENWINPAGKPRTRWVCLCDCGKTALVNVAKLRNGHTQSCGCLHAERTRAANMTHGKRHTRAYTSWSGMRSRCYTQTNPKYRIYGARGITVCDRWRDSFENFLADMGQPPAGMTLERDDPNGHYCKENCRWATPLEQANNLRVTIRLTHDGVTKTLTEWADYLGISKDAIYLRYRRGKPTEKILAGPSTARPRSRA